MIMIFLIVSLSTNLYIFGKWFLIDQWYEANAEERVILSEMVQKTVAI